MANLDTDGDGDSDAADYTAKLKLTDAERTALVPLYAPGDELFRVPIPHLSPWDHNWPYGPPQGARLPRLGPDGRPIPDMCNQGGSSTIGCEDQSLGEAVDIAGTPYRLSYASNWEPGRGGPRARRRGDRVGAARRPARGRARGRDRGADARPALRRSRRSAGLRPAADHPEPGRAHGLERPRRRRPAGHRVRHRQSHPALLLPGDVLRGTRRLRRGVRPGCRPAPTPVSMPGSAPASQRSP